MMVAKGTGTVPGPPFANDLLNDAINVTRLLGLCRNMQQFSPTPPPLPKEEELNVKFDILSKTCFPVYKVPLGKSEH